MILGRSDAVLGAILQNLPLCVSAGIGVSPLRSARWGKQREMRLTSLEQKKRSSEGKIMTGSFLKPPGFDFRSSFVKVSVFLQFWDFGGDSGRCFFSKWTWVRAIKQKSRKAFHSWSWAFDVAKTGFLEITVDTRLHVFQGAALRQFLPDATPWAPFYSPSPLDGVRLTERGANVFVSYNYPLLGSRLWCGFPDWLDQKASFIDKKSARFVVIATQWLIGYLGVSTVLAGFCPSKVRSPSAMFIHVQNHRLEHI